MTLYMYMKMSEKMNKRNLLKTCLQYTYPTDFSAISSKFYYGQKWKYSFYLSLWTPTS